MITPTIGIPPPKKTARIQWKVIRDHTTQLYRDYSKPLAIIRDPGSLLNNQDSMEWIDGMGSPQGLEVDGK